MSLKSCGQVLLFLMLFSFCGGACLADGEGDSLIWGERREAWVELQDVIERIDQRLLMIRDVRLADQHLVRVLSLWAADLGPRRGRRSSLENYTYGLWSGSREQFTVNAENLSRQISRFPQRSEVFLVIRAFVSQRARLHRDFLERAEKIEREYQLAEGSVARAITPSYLGRLWSRRLHRGFHRSGLRSAHSIQNEINYVVARVQLAHIETNVLQRLRSEIFLQLNDLANSDLEVAAVVEALRAADNLRNCWLDLSQIPLR